MATDEAASTTAAEESATASAPASESPAADDDGSASPSSTASATAEASASATPSGSAASARVGSAARAAAPQAAEDEVEECTPSDVSSSLTSRTLTDSSDDGDDVGAWEQVRADFTGALPEGGCAGDFVTITLPPELSTQNGSYPVLAADGTQMGAMVVRNGVATITFNDYIETHTDITYSGFLSASVRDIVTPGESYDLDWQVGDEVFTTPVTVEDCPNCDQPKTWAGKWASYSSGDPAYVLFGLESAQTRTAGERITFTDTLGEGQQLDCARIGVQVGDSISQWGAIEYDGNVTPDSVACDEASGTVTVTVSATAAGQYYRLLGRAYTTEERTSYTDAGTVSQAGVTRPVNASAVVYDGGVSGDGTTPATPTPTPRRPPQRPRPPRKPRPRRRARRKPLPHSISDRLRNPQPDAERDR